MNSGFSNQNFILKLMFIIFGVIASSFANLQLLIMLSAITIVYLLFEPRIILNWLHGFIKLSPLFTTIFLFGLFFNIPFDSQLVLAGRILLILLFSVYLTTTTTIEDFLADTVFLPQVDFFKNSRIFLIATFQFVPLFLDQYKIASDKQMNYIIIAKTAFWESVKQINDVERNTLEKLEDIRSRKFHILPNIYIVIVFILYAILVWIF